MAEARVGLHRNVPPNTCTLHLGLHMQAHVRTTHAHTNTLSVLISSLPLKFHVLACLRFQVSDQCSSACWVSNPECTLTPGGGGSGCCVYKSRVVFPEILKRRFLLTLSVLRCGSLRGHLRSGKKTVGRACAVCVLERVPCPCLSFPPFSSQVFCTRTALSLQ